MSEHAEGAQTTTRVAVADCYRNVRADAMAKKGLPVPTQVMSVGTGVVLEFDGVLSCEDRASVVDYCSNDPGDLDMKVRKLTRVVRELRKATRKGE